MLFQDRFQTDQSNLLMTPVVTHFCCCLNGAITYVRSTPKNLLTFNRWLAIISIFFSTWLLTAPDSKIAENNEMGADMIVTKKGLISRQNFFVNENKKPVLQDKTSSEWERGRLITHLSCFEDDDLHRCKRRTLYQCTSFQADNETDQKNTKPANSAPRTTHILARSKWGDMPWCTWPRIFGLVSFIFTGLPRIASTLPPVQYKLLPACS